MLTLSALFKLTRHQNVIETRPTGAVLVFRIATDCPKRGEVLDSVEVGALIVAVVVISVHAGERPLVRLNHRVWIINLLLSLVLILFGVCVLIRARLQLNRIIIIFGFV